MASTEHSRSPDDGRRLTRAGGGDGTGGAAPAVLLPDELAPGRPALRRGAWIVVDQGLSSLTNFAATVVVARSVDVEAFGAFAVALAVYFLCLGTVRGLIALPLSVRASRSATPAGACSSAAGAALLAGIGCGVAVAAAGAGVGGGVGGVLAVLGVSLPGLLLQDTWRYAFFAMGRPRAAVGNDVAWAVAQAVLLGGALLVASPGILVITALWGASGTLAACVGAVQSRLLPDLRHALAYTRRNLDLGLRYAIAFVFQNGSGQLTALFIAAIVGTAGVAALRGATVVFGPVTALFAGVMTGAIAEGSRVHARDPARLRPVLRTVSAGLAIFGLLSGVVALALPDAVGEALLGDSWTSAQELLVPVLVGVVGLGLSTGASTGLAVLEAADAALGLRVASGVAALGAGVTGAALDGAAGAAWGLALGPWLMALGSWYAISPRRRSQRMRVGAAAPSSERFAPGVR